MFKFIERVKNRKEIYLLRKKRIPLIEKFNYMNENNVNETYNSESRFDLEVKIADINRRLYELGAKL